MPELPEVETVRRGLAPAMEGRRILRLECRRPDLRFPLPPRLAERAAGRRIASVGRRAKYLLLALDDGTTLIAHLGMSGSFRVAAPAIGAATPGPEAAGDGATAGRPGAAGAGASAATAGVVALEAVEAAAVPAGAADVVAAAAFARARGRLAAHDHLVFHLDDGVTVTFNDPRRFGFVALAEPGALASHPHLAGLGIEPLDGALTPAFLAEAFAGKRAPLKAALLDQRIVAGLGNIYVCEALWRAGLSPERPAATIAGRSRAARAAAARLATAIRDVLSEAIAAGGSTLRDHAATDGTLGYFQHGFAVYGRDGLACPRCGDAVGRRVQSGRSTFWCATCQP